MKNNDSNLRNVLLTKNRLTLIILFFLSILFTPFQSIYTSLKPSEKKITPKATAKKSSCCKLETYPEPNVQLVKICNTPSSTIIYMTLKENSDACSYVDKITLEDNRGKVYKAIGMNGIANCPDINFIPKNTLFSWEFDKLEKGLTSISLEEDPYAPKPRPDWNWWKWENISISHCNL